MRRVWQRRPTMNVLIDEATLWELLRTGEALYADMIPTPGPERARSDSIEAGNNGWMVLEIATEEADDERAD
jgi:hypothetical protein